MKLNYVMELGTIAKITILNNQKYIGSEIIKKYCNIVNEQIPKNFDPFSHF